MMKQLGHFVEKRPWLVVILVLLITIGFSTLLPSIRMETATEEFMPDNEIVSASTRVSEYFGQTGDVLLIFVEKQNEQNVITPNSLKEEYNVLKTLKENFDEINSYVSLASFVDIMCQIEFGNTLLNCTDQQIITAYNDMMENPQNSELKMLQTDDKNEETDFNHYPKLSKGKNIDSLDIKNYYIDENNETLKFSIEVYDLSNFKEKILSPNRKINTWEWYIDFKNLITPVEELDINYQIAAHIEPSQPVWIVGNGIINNIRALINIIRNSQLVNSYSSEVYLWIKTPGQDISFPIVLNTGNITFNTLENKIEIEVEKTELGTFGIAPKYGSYQLPAKIGNTKAGVRIYQTSILNQPWSRIIFNTSYIQKTIENIQTRPLINKISTKILQRFSNYSWEDFDEIFEMLNSEEFAKDSISLQDIEDRWVVLDQAPDKGYSKQSFFIKPFFIESLKTSSIIFLSADFDKSSGPSTTLMIAQLNSTLNYNVLGDISAKIQSNLIILDNKQNYVSMKVTGTGIISNDINELTMDANIIIMPAIFVLICLILLVMFKQFSYVILPLAGIGISIIWLFGSMVLLGMTFNMIMVAIVPLLVGLGVDYPVHLFHEYRSELKKGKKPGPAIIISIKDIGTAMFLAIITTVIAFLSFLTTSIAPLRNFGLLCGLGLTYIFINTITFQAAVRYLLDRKKTKGLVPKNNHKISLDNYMEKFADFILKQRKKIIAVSVIITIIMLIGATQVQTTFDTNDFLPEGNESMELVMDVGEYFPSSSETQEYILIEGNVATVAALKGISKTYENLKDDKYIAKTPSGEPKRKSIFSIIKNAIKDNSSIILEFNLDTMGIPRTNEDVVELYDYLYNNPDYMMDVHSVLHYNGKKYDATIIRAYTRISYSDENNLDTSQQSGILYNDLKEDMTSYGDAKAIVTGQSSIMYTIIGSMTRSQIISTFISIILAALVIIIAFKNPILGIITVIPIGLCTLWIIGTIYFIGYSFNIMTIMITSLTIGTGIDYAIHATQRFRVTADRTGDIEKAVSKTVGHTGGALFIAAITTFSGFAMLILAPMPPEQQFGIITSMTIIYAYISSIIVLPPILMIWAKWRKKKKGYIISPTTPEED
jgi:predicted RND superfamily exporter protein